MMPGRFFGRGKTMNKIFVLIALLTLASPAFAEEPGEEPIVRRDTIFEVNNGVINAPGATYMGGGLAELPGGPAPGWIQKTGEEYVSFDALEIPFTGRGSLEITAVVVDAEGLKARKGDDLEALVMLYDKAGTPFFTVGMNGREFVVGSFPLHPTIMEDVFGGVSFPYLQALSGPPENGTEIKVRVAWGFEPGDDRVYVDGVLEGTDIIEGPRNMGPPGYEPTRTLGSFMAGFETDDKVSVGPPYMLTVGRVGDKNPWNPLSMNPPTTVAVKRVVIWKFAEGPQTP